MVGHREEPIQDQIYNIMRRTISIVATVAAAAPAVMATELQVSIIISSAIRKETQTAFFVLYVANPLMEIFMQRLHMIQHNGGGIYEQRWKCML